MKKSIISTVLLIVPTLLVARPATPEDFDVKWEDYRTKMTLDADGGGFEEYYDKRRLTDTADVAKFAVETFKFNAKFWKVEKITAYVTNGTTRQKVESRNIVIKPVSDNGPSVDKINQVSITYPNLQKGSVLELEMRYKILAHPIPNSLFEYAEPFSGYNGEKWKAETFSVKPLYYEISDPQHRFTVTNKKIGKYFYLAFEANKGLVNGEMDEKFSAPYRSTTWYNISTLQNTSDFIKYLEQEHEKILRAPLPPLFQKYLDRAKSQTTAEKQAESILESIANDIYYIQYYDAAKSSFIPRSLAEIARTKYGDCKDYSTATVALLRHLGWDAHVAIVYAAKSPFLRTTKYPNTNFYNHAIVYARKDGKEFWLDPTTRLVDWSDISSWISNRQALVLTSVVQDQIKQTPAGDYKKHSHRYESEYKRKDKDTWIQITSEEKGNFATNWTSSEIGRSKASLEQELIKYYGGNELKNAKLESFDLTSRIAKPLIFRLSGMKNTVTYPTTAGRAFDMGAGELLKAVRQITDHRVTDILLEENIGIRTYLHKFLGEKILGEGGECEVKSRWFDFRREYGQKGSDSYIQQTEAIKTRLIPLTEFQSKEFEDFKTELGECGGDFALIFKDSEL